MTPELALMVGQILIKYGPAAARGFVEILHIEKATKEDWERLVFTPAEKPYEEYVKPA